MGLFDFLNGTPGGMDSTGMGPPAPATNGLLDRLGGAFGGGGDINPALAAQLGLDPAKLKHEAAMQALARLGQGLLAGSTSNVGHPTFASALANGLGAAQSGPNPANDSIKQALAGQQIATAKQKEEHDKAVMDRADAFQQSIVDGSVQLPPEMEPMRAMIAQMPPGAVGSLMIDTWNNKQKAAHDESQQQIALDRADALEKRQTAAQAAMQSRALAAQNVLPPIMRAMSPEQQQAYLDTAAGITPKAGQATPADKAVATQTAKRMTDINGQLDKVDATKQSIDEMIAKIQGGAYDTGNALSRTFNTGAPAALRGSNTNAFDSDSNALVLNTLSTLKGTRGSNMINSIVQREKPSISNSNETNLAILQRMKAAIETSQQDLGTEANHYADGGTIKSWGAERTKGPGATGAPPDGTVVYKGMQKYVVKGGVPVLVP